MITLSNTFNQSNLDKLFDHNIFSDDDIINASDVANFDL